MKSKGRQISWVLLVVILAWVLLSGCESMWNRANRGFLERDLRMLLDEKCHVRVARIECRMLGTTRNAVCTFQATGEQIDGIVRGLSLTESVEGSEEAAFLESILGSGAHQGLEELEPFSGDGVKRYCSKRRGEELVLGNGVSFEYVILFVDPALDTVCVLLSYGYG